MQVFELHFNPCPSGGRAQNKEDRIIDSFCHQPANIYEKRLGNLYMAGELSQALPQNTHFLNNLAEAIKKEYYSAGLKKSCQQSLQDSLKKANEFLDGQVQKSNVSWLGNLNFSALSFSDFVLNFTKIGEMKILLVRNGQLLDISQNLESQEAEIHPLKVFGNIVTGKLAQNDKVIVLNKDVFSVLSQEKGFLGQLGQISDEKGLKEILKTKKQALAEVSGACLLLMVNEEPSSKQTLTFHQDVPKFSFQQTFIKPLTFSKLPMIPRIRIVVPRKKIILVLSLISLLALGFFIFH